MPDEIDAEVCCDAMLEAIEAGGIRIVEVQPGVYCEVIPDRQAEHGIALNFCPFCGEPRDEESHASRNEESHAKPQRAQREPL